MADPGLVKRMVEAGHDRQAAIEQIDAFMALIRAQLLADKTVRLDNICLLTAPSGVVKAGYPPNHLRKQRKVKMKSGAIIMKDEPYRDPQYVPTERGTYGR